MSEEYSVLKKLILLEYWSCGVLEVFVFPILQHSSAPKCLGIVMSDYQNQSFLSDKGETH